MEKDALKGPRRRASGSGSTLRAQGEGRPWAATASSTCSGPGIRDVDGIIVESCVRDREALLAARPERGEHHESASLV